MAILKIRDENEQIIEIPVLKGDKGDTGAKGIDGYTPIKGTDYWTAADKQEINSFVIEEVANHLDGAKADIVTELITQIGGMPVFGTVDDNNKITVTSTLADGTYTLMYENEDGTISKIGTITIGNGEVVTYTNLADTTLATDSTLTATSQGWMVDKRINSSYEVVDESGVHISNIIAVNNKKVLRVKGFNLSASYGRIYYYLDGACIYFSTNSAIPQYATICDGDYTEITIAAMKDALDSNSSYTDFDSFRIGGTLSGTKEDVIITLDEEIGDNIGGSGESSTEIDIASIGYTDGSRWSTTDGAIRDNATGYTAINKIPFERASGQTMIINLSGITWTDDALATQYAYILMFVDDSFTSGHNMPLKRLPKNYDNIGVSGVLNDDGTITITIKDGTNGLLYNGFKLCGVGSGANAKITITIKQAVTE